MEPLGALFITSRFLMVVLADKKLVEVLGEERKSVLKQAKEMIDLMAKGAQTTIRGIDGEELPFLKMPGFNEYKWAAGVFQTQGIKIETKENTEGTLKILESFSSALEALIAGAEAESKAVEDLVNFFKQLGNGFRAIA